jgi:hypothetical protein
MAGIEFQLSIVSVIAPLMIWYLSYSCRSEIVAIAQRALQGDCAVNSSGFAGISDETMDTLSLETYVARVMQSLMFVVCYCLCRIVASVSFWQSGFTVMKLIDLAFQLFIYGWTGFAVVPEAVVNTTIYWGLPPYCDNVNELTALACQQRGQERVKDPIGVGDEAARAKGANDAMEWAKSVGAGAGALPVMEAGVAAEDGAPESVSGEEGAMEVEIQPPGEDAPEFTV